MIPTVPGPVVTVRLRDTASSRLTDGPTGDEVAVYVCGITPYDATHLGHAATYVTFDVLLRLFRDAGQRVTYVQNVTDVDDPLLERAVRDGVDWTELAAMETSLFRQDMEALRVIPPTHYVGVVESINAIAADVEALMDRGCAYTLPVPEGSATVDGAQDVYLDVGTCPRFGQVSGWSRDEMVAVWAERGGDPERPGKHDIFDPLLWRAARPGEPQWPHRRLGPGRPGWHIECTSIAMDRLGIPFDIQGGGSDLIFPHHEMSAAQAQALTGATRYASTYVHQAMVSYQGHKMSKSRGNLVLVSALRERGVDPSTIRLALLAHHHGTDWEFVDTDLDAAGQRLAHWREAFAAPAGPAGDVAAAQVRAALADDLDSPRALAVVDQWAAGALAGQDEDPTAPELVRDLVDALLGVL